MNGGVDFTAESGRVIHRTCPSFKETFRTTKFIMETGQRLKLPPVACASACVLYHRFLKLCHDNDNKVYDEALVGTTALYLASKTEEFPCKLRDVINVSYRVLHQNKAPLEVGSLYWELRDSVVNCELMMLRTLQFHVAFNNPHKYLVHYLKSLDDWLAEESNSISQMSWSFLQDSFHTTLSLQFRPSLIAVAMIYFSVKCLGIIVPSQGAQNTWWKAMCPESTEQEIQAIIHYMMEFYSQENVVGE